MDLVVSSLGMVTSLGGVVTGSAAHRAGFSRPVELGSYYWAENDNFYPFSGHRAIAPSQEPVVSCWSELASRAVRELCGYGALPGQDDVTFWRRTAVMLAVPFLDFERFGWRPKEGERRVRSELMSALGLRVEPELLFWLPMGQTATARALALARRRCADTSLDRVVIVAVDSLVHPDSLNWLHMADRVRTRDTPMGLSPSEAGACFLVERRDACVKRGGRAEAVLGAESVVEARADADADAAATIGRHLAQAIRDALAHTGAPEPFDGDVYLDLNGEELSARAWAHAQVHLTALLDFARARVVLPCADLGDTGAANAAVAVCLGTRSFVRRYARMRPSLICSASSVRRDTSAIFIRPP